MGAKLGDNHSVQGDINVTPLIDVVLVLLIIFMVLTPQMIQDMSSQVPGPRRDLPKPDDTNKPDPLVVAMYDDGSLALNLKPMDRTELFDQVRRRLDAREAKKRVVFVDAHPDLEYGLVVGVMDLLKDAGKGASGDKSVRVGLARIKDEGPKRAEAASDAPAPTPAE